MSRYTTRNSTRGFTLVELLVVIAIIAFLALLSAGVFGSALARANALKCSSNLRNIGAAMLAYAANHNNNLPESGGTIQFGKTDDPNQSYGSNHGTGLPGWTEQVEPYLGKSTDKASNPIWQCPDSSNTIPANKRYSYFNGAHAAIAQTGLFAPVNLSRMRSPALHIIAGDISYSGNKADGGGQTQFDVEDADKDDYTQDPAFGGATTDNPLPSHITKVHNGFSNVVFADGHVESMRYFNKLTMTTVYDGPGPDYNYMYPDPD